MWSLNKKIKQIILFIRTLTGDNAYEKYLESHLQAKHDHPPLSKKEFFKQETDRKWNGVRRCC
jgi:uncharacterized short protein YbdD (DUF466 family)